MTRHVSDIHEEAITSVSFCPTDSNKLLTASADGTMKILDMRMYKVVKTFDDCTVMACNSFGSSRAIFSSGSQLAVVLTISGQVAAFDIDKEKLVGCVGSRIAPHEERSFYRKQ